MKWGFYDRHCILSLLRQCGTFAMRFEATVIGNPASKKTGQRIVRWGKRPGIMQSVKYKRWEAAAIPQLRIAWHAVGGREPYAGAVHVKALFYREDRRRVDLSNLLESVADALERAGVIVNDHQIESWDKSRRLYDPAKPRVELVITEFVA